MVLDSWDHSLLPLLVGPGPWQLHSLGPPTIPSDCELGIPGKGHTLTASSSSSSRSLEEGKASFKARLHFFRRRNPPPLPPKQLCQQCGSTMFVTQQETSSPHIQTTAAKHSRPASRPGTDRGRGQRPLPPDKPPQWGRACSLLCPPPDTASCCPTELRAAHGE